MFFTLNPVDSSDFTGYGFGFYTTSTGFYATEDGFYVTMTSADFEDYFCGECWNTIGYDLGTWSFI